MINKIFGFNKKATHKSSSHKIDRGIKDFSFIGTDIHSHIIPGLDDGAQTMDDSIEMVKYLQQLGFKSLITTPHIRAGHYSNTAATIHQGLHLLQHALSERGINMPIKAAAEYYVDEEFIKLLEKGEPLLTVNDNEILLEFSFVFEPNRLNDILYKIKVAGYQPILAHAERYTFYHNNSDRFRELKEMGFYLQLNLMSLSSYYGSKVKSVAENLLRKGLYDYCGSDAHHMKHLESVNKVLRSDIIGEVYDYPFFNTKL